MVTLINYYTCCYGDSLVAMFANHPVQRINGLASTVCDKLIEPVFYTKSDAEKYSDCQRVFGKFPVLPCHRQLGYDFKNLCVLDLRVITLTTNHTWLASRYVDIHLTRRKKPIGNAKFELLRQKHPALTPQFVKADYKSWINSNLLPTDIVFDLDRLGDKHHIKNFCDQYGLGYNADWIDNIIQDQKYYEARANSF
jgi:hypothetical protein